MENSVGWPNIIWSFLNAKEADKSSLVVSPEKREQDLFLKDFFMRTYISTILSKHGLINETDI